MGAATAGYCVGNLQLEGYTQVQPCVAMSLLWRMQQLSTKRSYAGSDSLAAGRHILGSQSQLCLIYCIL